VDYVNSTWSESTIDASNAPPLGAAIASNVDVTTADKNQYILVNVTSAVQAWLNGSETNNGLAVVANSSCNATFDSKENTTTSHPPELDIAFAGGDGTITGVTTASGSGLTGGGTSGTLNLSLTNGCAANQVLQYNGSAWACAAVGTGTITGVTAGTDLTGGGTSGNVTLSLNTAATNALYAQLGAANAFTGNQTVNGTFTATTTAGSTGVNGAAPQFGVYGTATGSGNTVGVYGSGADGLQGNGTVNGVYASTANPNGVGVFGVNSATTGTAAAVYGTTSSTTGYGVVGQSPYIGVSGFGGEFGVSGQSPTGNGVFASTSATDADALYAAVTATTGNYAALYGITSSSAGFGVIGIGATGVSGSGTTGNGVYGASSENIGVYGTSNFVGTYGNSVGVSQEGGSVEGEVAGIGVWGDTAGKSGEYVGLVGTADDHEAGGFYNDGGATTLWVENDTATSGGEVLFAWMPNLMGNTSAAIIGDPGCAESSGNISLQLGQTGMSACSNYTLAGNSAGSTFLNANSGQGIYLRVNNSNQLTVTSGQVDVIGTLSKGGGSFKIDHPLDPANKYLYHSFVESPDMMNIYNGVAELDASGEAVIALPDWFQALNRDFRYQLTPIGAPGPNLYIAEEVANNRFKIAGGKPGSKVSWQVTGIRQDAFANANRIPVEVEKAAADRGRYLYPEALGQPASARIGYEAPPPGSEQSVHHHPALPRNGAASRLQQRTPLIPPAPPKLVLPKAPPLPHPPTPASKPENNQK